MPDMQSYNDHYHVLHKSMQFTAFLSLCCPLVKTVTVTVAIALYETIDNVLLIDTLFRNSHS